MSANEERLVVQLEARVRDFEKNFARASQTATRNFDQIERRAKLSSSRLEKTMAGAANRINTSVKGIGLSMVAGLGVDGMRRILDTSTRIQNALKSTGLAGKELDTVYQELFKSAQLNGAPLESLVQLYSRVSLAQTDLGVSSGQIVGLVNTVGTALRASGGDAQSASGALLQLGQALGGGVVQAEEYNSLIDGLPMVLQAAANGIKEAGGSVSALTALVKSGQVTSKAFFDGIQAGASVLDDRLAGAEQTISGAFVRLQNVLVDTAMRIDDSTDASETLANFLNGPLASAISEIGSLFTGLGQGPVADFIGWLNAATEAAVQASADIGAALGTDRVGASFGAKPYVGPKRIQDRIDGAFEGLDVKKPAEVTVTKPARFVEPISLSSYPVPTKRSSGPGGSGAKTGSADEYAREVQQIKERTAAIQAETTAQAGINPLVDDFDFAMTKARSTQELLTAAQNAGLAITPELRSSIDALATGYANASVEAQKLDQSQDKVRQGAEEFAAAGKELFSGFISDLREGKSVSDALASAFNRLIDKLQDMALNWLFSAVGGGGIFGSIFGFAQGGSVRGPGTASSDSIPAMLSDGEFVVRASSAAKHRRLLEAVNNDNVAGFASGGAVGGAPAFGPVRSSAPFVITNNVSVAGSAGTPAQNDDLAAKVGKQLEATMRGVVVSEMAKAMRPGNIGNNRAR